MSPKFHGLGCLFLNTWYQGFLQESYQSGTVRLDAPYAAQLNALRGSFFGDADFYSRHLSDAGIAADDVIVNCAPLQAAWATGNGLDPAALGLSPAGFNGTLPARWQPTALAQIERLRPEILYVQDMNATPADFLDAARPHVALIAGQIACAATSVALDRYDVIFTSFPHFVDRFRAQGACCFYAPLAFDPRVLKASGDIPFAARDLPVTFVGGVSPLHAGAEPLLEALCRLPGMGFHGYGRDNLRPGSPVRALHHGEAWGLDMFRLLGRSRITINRHVDAAEGHANNMRLFEATGMGALLLTEAADNLEELFEPGREVLTYSSPEECVELAAWHLAHPKAAEGIARAGQARTLRDHTYAARMRRAARVLSRRLRHRREEDDQRSATPGAVSTGYEALDPDAASAPENALSSAWRDPSIPPRQRALVHGELGRMYRGDVPPPFAALAGILAPVARPGLTLLEIGCGAGYYAEVLEYLVRPPLAYVGVDYSTPMLRTARDWYPDTPFAVSDGAALPFANGSFDVAVSSCVLLHVQDWRRHVPETVRIAKSFVVLHRTPVYRTRPTAAFRKLAYGVPTFELVFNEREILDAFATVGATLHAELTLHADAENDERVVTYLLRKV